MNIGRNIKELRQRNNIKQAELAKNIDVPQSTLSKYENGKLRIDTDTLTKIAKSLNVNVNDLLGISNETTTKIGNFIINNKDAILTSLNFLEHSADVFEEYTSNKDSVLRNNCIVLMILLENLALTKDFNIELGILMKIVEGDELKQFLQYLIFQYSSKEGE